MLTSSSARYDTPLPHCHCFMRFVRRSERPNKKSAADSDCPRTTHGHCGVVPQVLHHLPIAPPHKHGELRSLIQSRRARVAVHRAAAAVRPTSLGLECAHLGFEQRWRCPKAAAAERHSRGGPSDRQTLCCSADFSYTSRCVTIECASRGLVCAPPQQRSLHILALLAAWLDSFKIVSGACGVTGWSCSGDVCCSAID